MTLGSDRIGLAFHGFAFHGAADFMMQDNTSSCSALTAILRADHSGCASHIVDPTKRLTFLVSRSLADR